MTLRRRQRCENCSYSSEEMCLQNNMCSSTLEVGQVECRRNSPLWGSGVGTGSSNQLFPFVNKHSWCGAWVMRPSNMVIWEEEEVDNG